MTASGSADDITHHAGDNLAKLLRMAGQISDFFKSYPDEQAVQSIADHINQFWTKRMREEFLAGYDTDAPELPPLLRQARALIRPGHRG